MTYFEFSDNIKKAGLTIKGFASLMEQNPISITNLSGRDSVPKNLAVISVLLLEIKKNEEALIKDADFKTYLETLFESMNLSRMKARVKNFANDKNEPKDS